MRKSRRKGWFKCGALAVAAACAATPAIACEPSESCPIEYDHLATQETDPFLFLGRVMDEEHPQWRRYRRYLRRYSDVRDCLVAEQRQLDQPNLLLIDWDAVGTGRGAEVCIFQIARSLGTVERIQKWLHYNEFRTGELGNYRGDGFRPRFDSQPVSNLAAYWPLERFRELKPSWLSWLTGWDSIYHYELILNFDQHNRISGVGVVTPTKIN